MLIDLPEEYLLWFAKKGFPQGSLGELMALCLEIKIEGLDQLIKPLKQSAICNLWLEHSDFQSKSPASAFSIKVGM